MSGLIGKVRTSNIPFLSKPCGGCFSGQWLLSVVRGVATTCLNRPEELLDFQQSQISCIVFHSLKGSTGRRVWSNDHAIPVGLKPGLGSIIMKPRTRCIATFA